MEIALIGNGLPDRWCGSPAEVGRLPAAQSARIDAADLVVRCNVATHYYRGWTGWRTDVLIVRSASGPHGWRLTGQYDLTIPDPVILQARQIIVLGDTPEDYPAAAIGAYLYRYAAPKHRYTFWPYEEYEPQTRRACGVPQQYVLTLGLIALQWIRETHPSANVLLAGWACNPFASPAERLTHDWPAEAQYLRFLETSGIVTLLDPIHHADSPASPAEEDQPQPAPEPEPEPTEQPAPADPVPALDPV